MTQLFRLALAAVLTAVFAVATPAPAAARMSCCGESCPSAPKKTGKCCQIAPVEKKAASALVRLPVVHRPVLASFRAPIRRPVFVVAAVCAVPPASVFDEAPSGLSPPASLA